MGLNELAMLAIAGAGIGVGWKVFQGRGRSGGAQRSRGRRGAREANDFHAVEIRCRGEACEVALGLRGKRFLASEAPPLPLPGCNSAHCECVYRHHEDRREGDRRHSWMNAAYMPNELKFERRYTRRGRRHTDRRPGGRT